MKRISFEYRVLSEIELTMEEVQQLIDLASAHYDFKCKMLSREGVLMMLRREMRESETSQITHLFSAQDLNLLAKVTELMLPGKPRLFPELMQLFQEANNEYLRLNPRPL